MKLFVLQCTCMRVQNSLNFILNLFIIFKFVISILQFPFFRSKTSRFAYGFKYNSLHLWPNRCYVKLKHVDMVDSSLFSFEHFGPAELFPHCSDSEIIDCVKDGFLPSLLTCFHHLDNIRCMYGSPIKVNSSFRDLIHNHRVGGSGTSQHLQGAAIDFQPFTKNGCVKLEEYNKLCECIFDYNDNAHVFGQMIVYGHFFHLGLKDDSCKSCSCFNVHFVDPKYNIYLYELSESRNYNIV